MGIHTIDRYCDEPAFEKPGYASWTSVIETVMLWLVNALHQVSDLSIAVFTGVSSASSYVVVSKTKKL